MKNVLLATKDQYSVNILLKKAFCVTIIYHAKSLSAMALGCQYCDTTVNHEIFSNDLFGEIVSPLEAPNLMM